MILIWFRIGSRSCKREHSSISVIYSRGWSCSMGYWRSFIKSNKLDGISLRAEASRSEFRRYS